MVDEFESDPLIDAVLGSYRIESLIGVGGMGRVYRGIHVTLGRVVAIKLLPQSLAQDGSYIQRFVREAQIAAQLSHPNLIACYDFGESEWGYYFVMEFVEGKSLADVLIERRRMKVEEVIPILRQVCVGLGYAHASGIIHRDIKPDNILLTHAGGVKVADLGLAKVEDKGESGLTMIGMAVGTPNYISPEQVRGQQDIDWRSDIYSLGATMFHCVTGRVPYEGNTPNMIMTRHVTDPVPFARQANPDVSEAFSNLLVRMMQKDAHLRIANCDEILKELDKMAPSYTGSPPSAIVEASALAASRISKSSADVSEREGLFWMKFGAFVLLVALVAGGYWVYHKEKPSTIPFVVQRPKTVEASKNVSSSSSRKRSDSVPQETAPAAEPKPVVPESPASEPVAPPQPVVVAPGEASENIARPDKTAKVGPVQRVNAQNPDLIKMADFVGTETEPINLNSKDHLILTAQQNIYLFVDSAPILSQLENQLKYKPEYAYFKVRLTVLKCVSLEAALDVRVYRLTNDPRNSFQYDRALLHEMSLKPTQDGYTIEFDITSEVERNQREGNNFGFVLMTSQGGEAVFASSLMPQEKLWPVLEIGFVPR